MLCPTAARAGISSAPCLLPSRPVAHGAAAVRGTGDVREALSEGFACRMRGKAVGFYSQPPEIAVPEKLFTRGVFSVRCALDFSGR